MITTTERTPARSATKHKRNFTAHYPHRMTDAQGVRALDHALSRLAARLNVTPAMLHDAIADWERTCKHVYGATKSWRR